MNDYYLMNKDRPIIEFSIESNPLGEKIKANSVEVSLDSEIPDVPLLRKAVKNDDISVWMTAWLDGRNYAKHKDHMKKWLKEWGINNTKGFIDLTHALSLNDSLWVKDVSSDLSWSEVNYYNNKFSDVAEKTAFDVGLMGLQFSPTSPEVTAEGTFPKCWRRVNGDIYLYKTGLTGAANVGLEPYSEFISSYVVAQLTDQNVLSYDLEMFKDKLCSVCKIFTSENEGYMPFYRYMTGDRQRYTISDVIEICAGFGFEKEVKEMFFTDSIIMNQDRHLGNFGFIVDNDSFEIKRFAPLYDYNSSLLCNALESDLDDFERYEDTFLLGHKLGGTFSEVGAALCTNELIEKIPKHIAIPVHEKYNLPQTRMDKIIGILNQNIKNITGKDYYSFGDEELYTNI